MHFIYIITFSFHNFVSMSIPIFPMKPGIKKINDNFLQSHRTREWQYWHLSPGLNDSILNSPKPLPVTTRSVCFSNLSVQTSHPGSLSRCTFWVSRSSYGPEVLISNRLPEDVGAGGPGTIFWTARHFASVSPSIIPWAGSTWDPVRNANSQAPAEDLHW